MLVAPLGLSFQLLSSQSLCPAVTWTLYGVVGSNLGEQNTPLVLNTGQVTTAPEFLYNNFHYKHDFIGWVVLILIAFVAAFWAAGWAAFRYLNFNVSPPFILCLCCTRTSAVILASVRSDGLRPSLDSQQLMLACSCLLSCEHAYAGQTNHA